MRITSIILLLLTLWPASNSMAKGIYQTPEDFINEVFDHHPPEAERVLVKGELSQSLKSILGHRYKKIRIPYWRAGDRTVWVLQKVGKELPITAGFVVSGDHISQFKVLVFRESRGWEIRNDFFTQQFTGMQLNNKNKLSQPIDNITGATLSVNAMKKLSHMALYLHQYVTSQTP